MMILPIIFLTFLRLQNVLSTSNHSVVYGYTAGVIDDCEKHNLHNLLETLTSQTLHTAGLYNFSTTYPKTPNNQLHGLYLCRGDVVDPQDCHSCVNSAKDYIFENSFYGYKGLVWYDHCMVRYSNESFLGKLDTNMMTSSWDNSKIKGNRLHFMMILRNTMKALAIQASNGLNGNKFASKVVKYTRFDSLYAMVQCTPDLLASDCYWCLTKASHKLFGLRGTISGEVLYSSCMAQYKTTFAVNNTHFTSAAAIILAVSPINDSQATISSPISLTGTKLDAADRSE